MKGVSKKIMFVLPDDLEAEFRETVRNKYRGRSVVGMLSYSASEAIEDWIKKQQQKEKEEKIR